jgi:hypothetical protein
MAARMRMAAWQAQDEGRARGPFFSFFLRPNWNRAQKYFCGLLGLWPEVTPWLPVGKIELNFNSSSIHDEPSTQTSR